MSEPVSRPHAGSGGRAGRPTRLQTALLVALFGLFGGLCALAAADAANPPDMTRALRVSPEVVDRHGVLLRAFLTSDGYWRLKTKPRDVSPRYLAMLKAYEDKRFDAHWGVDPIAIARAALQYLSAGRVVSGGSTLTMQVARILEPPRSRGIGTKLFQVMRALQLEERYSKDEILSFYLTLAPFGGNLEGVRAASLSYFGKDPSQLDLSEAALLVALPQSPVKQRPDRHALRAAKGRDKVLARMVSEGIVTKGDADVARREGVPFARQTMPLSAPHLATRLHGRSRDSLIVTTLDAPLQAAVERMAAQETPYFGDGAANQGQVYESFNMAELWKLPVVYIIENNLYAMGTHVVRASAMSDFSKRGISFNIPGEQVDGMDVRAIKAAAVKAAEWCRSGNGPIILEMMTYRYRGHSMSDPAKYRSKEEVQKMRMEHDPIEQVRARLLANEMASEDALKEIDAGVRALVAEAADFASHDLEPDPAELFTDVFA